jgi:hypothetical protein
VARPGTGWQLFAPAGPHIIAVHGKWFAQNMKGEGVAGRAREEAREVLQRRRGPRTGTRRCATAA